MILFGVHSSVYPVRFFQVRDSKLLCNEQYSPSSAATNDTGEVVVWFKYDITLAQCAKEHKLHYAVLVESVEEFLLVAYFSPAYIMLYGGENNVKIKACQAIADRYLLDSKVLCVLDESSKLDELAECGIDGVVTEQILYEKS